VAVPAPSRTAPLADAVGRPLSQPTVTFADRTDGGLDRALGGDWALVEIGEGSAIDARSGYWGALGARHVRVLPAGSRVLASSAGDGLVTVIEAADTVVSLWGEASAAGAGPVTLLVRPDKYVAAVIPPGGEDRVISALETYEAPLVISRQEEA
jgi:3-(3-hydroxy-phenyl)propionate hydroxylase